MKYVLFLLIWFAATATFAQPREIQPGADTLPCAGDDGLNPGIVPGGVGADIFLFPDSSSWRKMDNYYRDIIMVRFKDCLFYHNVRLQAIWHMIQLHALLERGDITTIEFYANELFELDYIDPGPLTRMLKRLKGHWPDLRLFDIARKEYQDIQDKIATFPSGAQLLEKNKEKLRALQDFIESVDPH